jgi:class 3 adenylate cyclase
MGEPSADVVLLVNDDTDGGGAVVRCLESLGYTVRVAAELPVSATDDGPVSGHRREIAVLHCELRGFTSFSELAAPDEAMDVLRQFHTILGILTREFGATVGFFAGDGVMVFFEDPHRYPEPAEPALRMAVALRDRMMTITRDWRRQGQEIGFRVGMATGFATLGRIGFEGMHACGVIGGVVTVAGRLCDAARHGQILVSKRAHAAVEAIADSEEVGRLTLEGVYRPVTAFSVVGLRPPPEGATSSIPEFETSETSAFSG